MPPSARREDDDFQDLLRRAGAGDLAAWERLHRTYNRDLTEVIRVNLPLPARKLFDAEDLLQEVWRLFFTELRDGYSFGDWEHLDRHLSTVARNEAHAVYRRYVQAQKRSLRHEVPLESRPEESEEWIDQRLDPFGTVDDEEERDVLQGQVVGRRHEVLRSVRAGNAVKATAVALRVSVRTVERDLEELKRFASARRLGDDPKPGK
jgi:DNA-directed RNA polymerase specialized sigma24 family protein